MIAVKIDNHPDARPQSGLQEADAVYELIVEGGLTRFIAMFLQTDSEYIGPIRSMRPTDPALVRPLEATLQISGGQYWIRSIADYIEVPFIGESSPNTFRIPSNGRARERTLFGATDGMRTTADQINAPDEPPGPWFNFGEPTPSTTPARSITHRLVAVQRRHLGLQRRPVPALQRYHPAQLGGRRRHARPGEVRYLAGPQGSPVHRSAPRSGTCRARPARRRVRARPSPSTTASSSKGPGLGRRPQTRFCSLPPTVSELVLPPGRIWISVVPDTRDVTWE